MKDNVKKQVLDFATYLDNETFLNNKPLTNDELSDYFEKWLNISTKKNAALAEEVKDWIDEWNNLFPSKTYNASGKSIRVSFKGLNVKMTNFIRNYGYSKEIIFDATIAYLKYWKARHYTYCRTSSYFIDKKDEGSDLADWCNRVIGGEYEEVLTDEQVVPNNNFL